MNTNAQPETIQTPDGGTYIVISRKTAADFTDDRGHQARMERDGIDAELTLRKPGRSKKLYACEEYGGDGQLSFPTEIRPIAPKHTWSNSLDG